MNVFLFFDFIWKFLFFVSVISTFYFVVAALSPHFFRFFSASKKMAAIKFSQATLVLSFLLVSLYLSLSDHNLVKNCFSEFAAKEGVFGITRIISIVWFIGFIFLVSKDIFQYLKIVESLKKSILKRNLFKAQNENRDVIEYYEVKNCFEPVVAGFLSPKIYVPSFICKNDEALKQILSHEYIHIKNKDGLWNFVSLLLHRLNWHNPLAYFAARAVKLQLEMATDELAVSKFNLNIIEYVRHMVSLISSTPKKSPLMMNASGNFLQMQSRLLHLKNIQGQRIKNKSLFAWVLMFTLGMGLNQAVAFIRPVSQSAYKAQMCIQVKHEIIIESWLKVESISKTNKCE